MIDLKRDQFDKTNAIIAAAVYLVSFIVYAMTVQSTFSFWDCGEFVACSAILGIPHPPGTPLFVLIGRIFSILPLGEDIGVRVNYMSVIFSAFTAMFSYLLTVRLIRYFFTNDENSSLNRYIAYIGGITGAFFVAFSRTNWGNSVEAEVYGLALALSVMIVWLTIIYFEKRGTLAAAKVMVLAFYLALLGVGVHMTVFLVVPVCAILFVLNREATTRDWLMVCGFVFLELLLIIAFADGRGSVGLFYIFSAVMAVILVVMLYKKVNWAVLIAIASVCLVMDSFSLYLKALPVTLVALILISLLAKKRGWHFQWKTGLAILLIAFIGLSTHLFVPIRSELNPRIDENNPSRDFRTFINFLDRKQYGQMSMVERMFNRRGTWSNQFGRHAHMGFWSYFEEQYSNGGWSFILPFFALGLIGLIVAIRKRLEIGLPFFALFMICSVGLVLYMNFADGIKFNLRTGDAYLEVRNRDYFFTPAFVFFGIAMGMGVAAVMQYLREFVARSNPNRQKIAVYASSILVLLPTVTLAHNYHASDRSGNNIPYNYAANILDSCEPNAILFTAGDNDTFPLWCIQEAYNYRMDVTVVNLSLANTDWYIEQMKNRHGVPISLTDSQIVWHPQELAPGVEVSRPYKMFHDRPRKRRTYLTPTQFDGRVVKVQDMMMDEIVLENKWQRPIFFTTPPYAESPLKLRDRATSVGMVYKLEQNPPANLMDVDKGYDLFMNTYRFDGYENSAVYRNENATGVYQGLGVSGARIFDALQKAGDFERAEALAHHIIESYPEYWQMYVLLGDHYDAQGDSATASELITQSHDTLTAFFESNPDNLFYMQDLGLMKVEMGERFQNAALIDEGISLIWRAFNLNSNSGQCFRKLVTVLSRNGRFEEIGTAARQYGDYKMNMSDPFLQQLIGVAQGRGSTGP